MLDQNAFQQMMANAQQMQMMQMQFNQFAQQFQGGPGQMNPQAIVQQKLNSGEMTQAQFEQIRQQANMLMGTNH